MKKTLILCFLLLVGCSEWSTYEYQPNPIVQSGIRENHRLQSGYDLLVSESNQLQKESDKLETKIIAFINSLNDDQLKAYDDLNSKVNVPNEEVSPSAILLAVRKLRAILPDEQFKILSEIEAKKAEINKKKHDISQEYANLVKQQQANRQAAQNYTNSYLYQQQQRRLRNAQTQRYWQNYYNQMMLQHSLSGIESAIRNK